MIAAFSKSRDDSGIALPTVDEDAAASACATKARPWMHVDMRVMCQLKSPNDVHDDKSANKCKMKHMTTRKDELQPLTFSLS
jgi:hypothetical protein